MTRSSITEFEAIPDFKGDAVEALRWIYGQLLRCKALDGDSVCCAVYPNEQAAANVHSILNDQFQHHPEYRYGPEVKLLIGAASAFGSVDAALSAAMRRSPEGPVTDEVEDLLADTFGMEDILKAAARGVFQISPAYKETALASAASDLQRASVLDDKPRPA